MSTAGFGRPSDGKFKSIWIKGSQILDENKNLKVKNTKITGKLVVTGTFEDWSNADLPDSDNASWAPQDKTHYFHSSFTSMRTLTISQASVNALHPSVPDKTMIRFDFPPTLTGDTIALQSTDINVFQDESMNTAPTSYEYIYYMNGGYLLKEAGVWIIVMPVLSWD